MKQPCRMGKFKLCGCVAGKNILGIFTHAEYGIEIKTVTSPEPIQAVIAASENVDLTIVGTSRLWGIERQTLGRYTDQLAIQCRSSLLITRRYSQVTSHLTALLPAVNTQEITDNS